MILAWGLLLLLGFRAVRLEQERWPRLGEVAPGQVCVLLGEDPWEDSCPTAVAWAWCGAGRVLGPSWPTAAGRSCLLAALPRESLPVGVGLTLLELHGLGGARLGGEIVTP